MPRPSRRSRSAFPDEPFVMPNESDLHAFREEERARALEERALAMRTSVRDKTTFTSRVGGAVAAARAEANAAAADEDDDATGAAASTAKGPSAPAPTRRQPPETMTDFIAKKREIFLVQMALDTKHAEIRKLEERATRREEALARSERMLEEDAARFDAFLKENDLKVQEAIRQGELEAKRKNDKVQEIKRLNANITIARGELGKREERLNDCERYKEFLDGLTPPEFFEEQDEIRRGRRAARRAARQAKRDEHARMIQDAADLEAEIPVKEQLLAEATRRGRKAEEAARADLEASKEAASEARRRIPDTSPPPSPPNDDSDEDTPMYFVRPSQLPELFSRLEEKNLFLMQNGQEAEEALEHLRNKQREMEEAMDAETNALRAQIDDLRRAIAEREEKAAEFRSRDARDAAARKKPAKRTTASAPPGKSAGGAVAVGSNIPLEKLAERVGEVYSRCGFDYDPSMSTIQMLTQIESKLERCLAITDEMPETYVRESEKARERVRRGIQRLEKAEQDKAEAEERAAKSLERSLAPVKKKAGKPMMTRSLPPSRKKKIVKPQIDPEEAALMEFLATDF